MYKKQLVVSASGFVTNNNKTTSLFVR